MLVKTYTLAELKSVLVLSSLAARANRRSLNLNVITTKGQAVRKLENIIVPIIDQNNSVNEVEKGEKY